MQRILFILLFLLLAACSPHIPANTGVEGQVLIGPTCPVIQLNNPCPDKPYQATFSVLKPDGGEVTRFVTDSEGRFHVLLPPGDYILHPESPRAMPRAPEQGFTIVHGQFTQLTVTYDSRIR